MQPQPLTHLDHHSLSQVYYVSNGKIKPANKRFSRGINNDYELTFDRSTTIQLAQDDRAIKKQL